MVFTRRDYPFRTGADTWPPNSLQAYNHRVVTANYVRPSFILVLQVVFLCNAGFAGERLRAFPILTGQNLISTSTALCFRYPFPPVNALLCWVDSQACFCHSFHSAGINTLHRHIKLRPFLVFSLLSRKMRSGVKSFISGPPLSADPPPSANP